MKQFTILLTLLFALMNTGCEEEKEEQTDYINCKWLTRTYRIGNSVYRSTYWVTSCPSQVNDKHTIYDCEWVHLYLDTQLLEYKRVGQGIQTYDLTITPDYEYDRF